MLTNSPTVGGNLKGASIGGGFNHQHAISMGHLAAAKMHIAALLGGGVPRLGGPPQMPQAPQMGGMPSAPGAAPAMPARTANFKAHIGHAATVITGKPVSHNDVIAGIDSLTQKGHFTKFQGDALKQHNGPLVGSQGAQVLSQVTQEVARNKSPGAFTSPNSQPQGR